MFTDVPDFETCTDSILEQHSSSNQKMRVANPILPLELTNTAHGDLLAVCSEQCDGDNYEDIVQKLFVLSSK